MWCDIEAVLVSALSGLGRVGTRTPANLLTALPYVQVQRIHGGADDRVTDTARVDVDVFTARDPTNPNRGAAFLLSEQVRALMLSLRHTEVDGVLIDTVETLTAPAWLDYGDEHVNRYLATYELTSRLLLAP